MRSDTRADLLQELGITSTATLETEQIPLGSSGVAQGFVAGERAARELSDTFVDLAVQSALPFLLTRHALEPAVVRVENAAAIRAIAGSAEVDEDVVLLDGRHGHRAGVVVETAGGPILVDIDAGVVRITQLDQPGGDTVPASWKPLPERLSQELPSLSTLLGSLSCAGWLRARVESLAASSWVVDQVAALGTVLRLWSPTAAEGEALLRGETVAPSTVAGTWARALPPAERAAVELLAVQQAAALRRRLDALEGAGEDPVAGELLALLHERDALESVLGLLWLSGEGRGLGAQLALLDDLALASLSALSPSAILEDDELLQVVFTSEPEAWWGKLAAG